MNSPAARRNATKQTNRAAMRITMATLKPCDCGEPSVIAIPTHDRRSGRPMHVGHCLECSTEFSRDAVDELIAMLEALHDDA
jgi:hypothetical protein